MADSDPDSGSSRHDVPREIGPQTRSRSRSGSLPSSREIGLAVPLHHQLHGSPPLPPPSHFLESIGPNDKERYIPEHFGRSSLGYQSEGSSRRGVPLFSLGNDGPSLKSDAEKQKTIALSDPSSIDEYDEYDNLVDDDLVSEDDEMEEDEKEPPVCKVCLKDKEHWTDQCPFFDSIPDPKNTQLGFDYMIVCKCCRRKNAHPNRDDWEGQAAIDPSAKMYICPPGDPGGMITDLSKCETLKSLLGKKQREGV